MRCTGSIINNHYFVDDNCKIWCGNTLRCGYDNETNYISYDISNNDFCVDTDYGKTIIFKYDISNCQVIETDNYIKYVCNKLLIKILDSI